MAEKSRCIRASSLPEEPDREAADALALRLHERHLRSLPRVEGALRVGSYVQ